MENYEQKYKESLERCKSWMKGEHPECFSEAQKAAEFIFPELRESEDERIRKALIERFKWELKGAEEQDAAGCSRQKDIEMFKQGIAWLEKQGEKSWSEEDDDNIKCICSYLELYLNHATDINEIEECKYLKGWLKSLKPNHWKPSKEQMSMLLAVLNDSNNITSESVYIALKLLYNDLKKL